MHRRFKQRWTDNNPTQSDYDFHDAFKVHCFVASFIPSGKPSGNRLVRLPGQVLHATLQEWEFTELHNGHQTTGQPLYCQGVFDAITMGELRRMY